MNDRFRTRTTRLTVIAVLGMALFSTACGTPKGVANGARVQHADATTTSNGPSADQYLTADDGYGVAARLPVSSPETHDVAVCGSAGEPCIEP
ncbi:MAG: hypothetical protein HY071_02610 [Chloroflexi bacterium]|nr:hypothetical protein [Chloroflexota bacterium]